MVDETSALPGYTHKIVDLEEADKETMHLLVFLLMQFLSRQDQVNKLFFNSNFYSLFLHKKTILSRLTQRMRNLYQKRKESFYVICIFS